MNRSFLAAGAALVVSVSAWAQESVPMTPLTVPGEPAEALPRAGAPSKEKIYDEGADAKAQIAAAVVRAGKNNRRVLVQWGANWCGWCHLLHETFASDKDIKKELNYEYDLVLVDVGRFDKNLE